MNTIARVDAVTKKYGKTLALNEISLEVRPGLTAFLGPNGAGKSTLIDIICGLRAPDSGSVTVLGGRPQYAEIRARIGLTSQATGLPMRLSVRETLNLCAAHYRKPADRGWLVDTLDLSDLLKRRNGVLSGGQRRRVAIAVALVGNPDFMVLDEPTTGLDLESRERLWAAMRTVSANGTSIVLSTHYLEEAEALADHVVLLSEGRIAREGSVTQVCAAVGMDVVELDLSDTAIPASATEIIDRIDQVGRRSRLFTRHTDELVRRLVRADVPFSGLTVSRAGLADAIRALGSSPEPEVRELLGVGL